MGVCVGCGLWINPETGLLEVEIDPAHTGLSCSDAGLAVTFPTSDSNASSLTVGSNPCPADKENLLTNDGSGVRALHTGSKAGIKAGPLSWDGTDVNMVEGTPAGTFNHYYLESPQVAITIGCGGAVAGTTEFAVGGFVVEVAAGGYVECQEQISQTYTPVTTWVAQSPNQLVVMDNRTGTGTQVYGIWLVDRTWNIIDAVNPTVYYSARVDLSISYGTAVVRHRGSAGYEFTWHYSHAQGTGLVP